MEAVWVRISCMNPKQQGLHLIHINHPVKGRDLIGMCVVLITNLTSVKQIEQTASILQYHSANFRQSIVIFLCLNLTGHFVIDSNGNG